MRSAIIKISNKEMEKLEVNQGRNFIGWGDKVLIREIKGEKAIVCSQHFPDFELPLSGLEMIETLEERKNRENKYADSLGKSEKEFTDESFHEMEMK